MTGFDAEAAARFSRFSNTHALLARLRDGVHPERPGGQVRLRDDPQLSICGIVHKLASGMAKRLSRRDVLLAPAA
jgi:hypothetical protein